jgi:hypothetical protein
MEPDPPHSSLDTRNASTPASGPVTAFSTITARALSPFSRNTRTSDLRCSRIFQPQRTARGFGNHRARLTCSRFLLPGPFQADLVMKRSVCFPANSLARPLSSKRHFKTAIGYYSQESDLLACVLG